MQPITEEKFLSIIPDYFSRVYNEQEENLLFVIRDSYEYLWLISSLSHPDQNLIVKSLPL